MEKYASESGHWYDKNGTPAYTQPNKSKPGEERNTTLRDAKKLELVPSVTTVMKLEAKPGLERWKMNQVILACLTLPRIESEGVDEFEKRIWIDANEHAKVARENGTRIHGILENYYKGGHTEPGDMETVVAPVLRAIKKHFGLQEWEAEKSFSSPGGYGGKVDLHSKDVVIDFKTKEFTEDKLPGVFPEQKKQLSAYANGLGLCDWQGDNLTFPRCANVFVSVSVPGLVHVVEHKQKDLQHAFDCFLAQLIWWQKEKKYESGY